MTTTNNRQKTQKMTKIGFLIALIVVLQTISALLVKFGFFSISLTLVPIVIGGFLLGPATGALLGGVFGVITFLFCAVGLDAGGAVLFAANPFFCGVICLTKAILAGWLSALLYRFSRKTNDPKNHPILFIIFSALSAGLCPLVNTLVFCAGMTLFFKDVLYTWAGGTDVAYYLLTVLIGVNFIVEFAINVVLCPSLLCNLLRSRRFRDLI